MQVHPPFAATLKPLRGEGWQGKRVLVVGLARSGLAAAQLLLRAGAKPLLYDQKPPAELPPELQELLAQGCTLGQDADGVRLLEGMDAVIISPGVPIDAPVVLESRRRGIPCIGELELASRFVSGLLIAVTGTNGKTTTVSLLGEMFRQAGRQVQVAGNIGFPLSSAVLHAGDEDIIVAEVSSFQLESVDTFHPHIAAILNISPDHLNRHGSMATYQALKQRVFVNQGADDCAVLNLDCPLLRELAPSLNGRVAWFSRSRVPEQGCFLREGKLWLRWQGEELPVCAADEIAIPGEHNLENALAAVCMAAMAGVPPAVIRHSLRSFAGVEHRMEFVRELDGVRYINDSKGTNPDAAIRAVRAMHAPTILLAGGFDKQVSFDEFAQTIRDSRQMVKVILFGQTADQIEEALRAQGYQAVAKAEDLIQATQLARREALPGYNILLSPACASFDQFADYEQRGRAFKAHVFSMLPDPRHGNA